jgi:hypothetical protein
MNAKRVSLPYPFLLALPALLVACSESPTGTASDVDLPEAPAQQVVAAIACSARVAPVEFSCRPNNVEHGVLGPQFLIIGGQGTYVLLESPVTGYNERQQRFTAEVYLTNLIGQPIGTDGATTTGVHVFFITEPYATDGSGLAVTVNYDDVGTFTNVNQQYFGFPETLDETLAPDTKSARRNWHFSLSSGATSFAFEVYVAADVAYPHGWVEVSPAAATIEVGGIQQLTAAVFDLVGDPVTGRSLTWGSSNPSVASVDDNGLVTAGTSTGTAVITATPNGPEAPGTSTITVTTAAPG